MAMQPPRARVPSRCRPLAYQRVVRSVRDAVACHGGGARTAMPRMKTSTMLIGCPQCRQMKVAAGRAHAPLAVAAARHLQHAAQPADGVLVAMLADPGVLHRGPLAKYAVAFRRTSTSSFASASSLRKRLFSASSSLTGSRAGTSLGTVAPLAPADAMPRLGQLPNVATGTPRRHAASCPPTDAASLTASALNSCVYCLLGSLPSLSRFSIPLKLSTSCCT